MQTEVEDSNCSSRVGFVAENGIEARRRSDNIHRSPTTQRVVGERYNPPFPHDAESCGGTVDVVELSVFTVVELSIIARRRRTFIATIVSAQVLSQFRSSSVHQQIQKQKRPSRESAQ